MASYENQIYATGGTIGLAAANGVIFRSSMLNTPGSSESLAKPFNLDLYIHVMDFSKPFNSSQNSIDISTDNITTAIRLPAYIGDGALFISDGMMHMLPGDYPGDYPEDTINVTTKVWDFNLKTQKLDVQDSEVQYQVEGAAIAFDTEKQVGWYYGGVVMLNHGGFRYSQDLYRLDRGKGTPTKVDVDSSFVGAVFDGELVYIKNIGEAGVLVIIGGATNHEKTQMVSMMDLN